MKKLLNKIFSSPTPLKRILIGIAIGLIFSGIISLLYIGGGFDSLEYIFTDFRTTSFTNYKKIKTRQIKSVIETDELDINNKYKIDSSNTVIEGDLIYILVDDKSINQFEKHDKLSYPWPRYIWGEMAKFLYASGIKSLVYDISFFDSHPEKTSGGLIDKNWLWDKELADTLYKFNDTALATAFTRSFEKDQFATDIKQAQTIFSNGSYTDALFKLALSYFNTNDKIEQETAKNLYYYLQEKLKEIDKEKEIVREYKKFEERVNYIKDLRNEKSNEISKYRLYNFETDDSVKIDKALDVEQPIKLLLGEPYNYGPANSLGDVKVMFDDDGVARRTVVVVEYDGCYYPSLALAGVMEALKFDPSIINIKIIKKKLYLGNKKEARKLFLQYLDNLKILVNDFDKLASEDLKKSLNNIITVFSNIDIEKEIPVENIEELLKDTEREFAKFEMLINLMGAYISFKNNTNENTVKNFAIFLRETQRIFSFKFINSFTISKLYKALDSYGTNKYETNIEKVKNIINDLPQNIYTNFSQIIHQISVYFSKLGIVENIELGSLDNKSIEINDNNYKIIFDNIKEISEIVELTIRKLNEVKNARIIPIDQNGLLRLKFYGQYKVLPNISIHKVIKTWVGIKNIWEQSIKSDIVELALQNIKNNTLEYAGKNISETIIKDKIGKFYLSRELSAVKVPGSKNFPRETIKELGKIKLIEILINEIKNQQGSDWFYILKNMDKNNRITIYNQLVISLKTLGEFRNITSQQIFNFVSTSTESLIDLIWNTQFNNDKIKQVLNIYGLEKVLNQIKIELVNNNPTDYRWVEYYIYNDNKEELNTIYKNIAKSLILKTEFSDLEESECEELLKVLIPSLLHRIRLWAIEYMFDVFSEYTEEDIFKFYNEFTNSLKNKSNLARRLLKQKVLFTTGDEKELSLNYTDEDGDKLSFEEAFENRLNFISIGAYLIEEYVILRLERKGEKIIEDNIIIGVVDLLNDIPSPSPEDLLEAVINITKGENTSSEIVTVIDNVLLVKPSDIKDKVILVLSDAASLLDLRKTPFFSSDAGGNIHGHGIMNIINNDYVYEYGKIPLFTIITIIIVCTLIGIISVLFPIKYNILIFIFVFVVYNVIAIAVHYFGSIFIEMSTVSIGILVTFIGGVTLNFILESNQKKFVEGAFSQFLASEILNKLLKDPSTLALGGETKELTIFFSDIAGFTTISEKLTPQELVDVLNYYLTEMADIIVVDNSGYVDKYEGDAVMAFWGAPVDDDSHALKACYAALDNQKKLKDIQEYFATKVEGGKISIRIGINTGPVVVGLMGSKKKLNYTVIGDAVNLASRLEGANKQFSTEIMISEYTYKHVQDDVEVRELDLLQLKGKKEPTRVFELICRKGEISSEKVKVVEIFHQGLKLYRERKFKEAVDFFKKALEIDENDGPSKTYIKRAKEYIKNPPPEDWTGVYVMTTK